MIPGQLLGNRYRIDALLGRGGMGEVFRAFDVKLQVEVALKRLRPGLFGGERALETLRQEVRSARQVVSSHVCRVFDLVELEGQELVSMEHVDGKTLLDHLREKGPLGLREASEIASQFLSGLEAIHRAGFVHRDVKPENLMLTRSGRVVVMDFGIAKPALIESGTVSGTPAYMAPEQARGERVDARADVFSAGVVLAEMIAAEGVRDHKSRETVWKGVHSEPPKLPDTPWVPVLRKAVARNPEQRHASAAALARALEEVTLRVEGAEDLRPYPGLSSFTEAEAEYFFGRELEVEAMWRRLQRPYLLGLIGPSGAGKSSFLRAGLLPAKPAGWRVLVATPGSRPFMALAQVLMPEVSGDLEAMQGLLRFEEADVAVSLFQRWRQKQEQPLLIVDQFEELFTLNPPEVQARFAELLGRLALEADVHVLLSMRDDFLFHCAEQPALAPVFSELTPLRPLSSDGFRRALVQPALKCGYRFEDEALVEEMLAEVESERGALPLVAFAAARLWEKRDRENGLLTRKAHQEIGGVAGALAQHAEATLERIGEGRIGIVRELFRNLVTAQGTRGAPDREELLSVCADRPAAEEVLRQLVDARLLTSFEVPGAEGEPEGRHRIEIIHESLLSAWPRLVRWQAQEADGAKLRDELRQAAQVWEEHERTEDRLWTGTAYQEFQLWRGRYPGGLTSLEEAFAKAMADRAERQRRRRQAIAGTIVAAALAVAAVTGVLWRRARSEALRAEAGKLLALGRAELDADTTAAVAYARKSLELTDTPVARSFAVEAFWRSPTARILPVRRIAKELGVDTSFYRVLFTPDGRWFAARSADRRLVLLCPRDGGPPRHVQVSEGNNDAWGVGPGSDFLLASGPGRTLRLWSVPDLREVRTVDPGGIRSGGMIRGNTLLTVTRLAQGEPHPTLYRAWPLPDGEPKVLGTFSTAAGSLWNVDPSATWMANGERRTVRLRSLDPARPTRERVLSLKDDVLDLAFAPHGDRLATLDRSGEMRLWSLAPEAPTVLRILEGPRNPPVDFNILFDPQATRLAKATAEGAMHVWDLGDPPDAQPTVLRRRAPPVMGDFDPAGWLATNRGGEVDFWPLAAPRVRRLRGHTGGIYSGTLAFTSDGRWLASVGSDAARLWPLDPAGGRARALVSKNCVSLATHPARPEILIGDQGVLLVAPDGATPRTLLDHWEGLPRIFTNDLAFDSEGRKVVAVPFKGQGFPDPRERVLRVWDLVSGQERVYSVAHLTDASWWGYSRVRFAADGSVFAAGQGGVFRLALPDQPEGQVSSETVFAATAAFFDLSADGRHLLAAGAKAVGVPCDELVLFDLVQNTSRRITTHGRRLTWAALDPAGRVIVTGDADGVVRVGPLTGEEPHLLLGHSAEVTAVAASPDGHWIASAAGDEIRLWPMPDVTKPPLHTLPHAELLARLDTWTNLRVMADPTSSTGWKLDVGPFPGWETAPTW